MNNPRVYGHCDAGCKRRVPTYEEFEKSVSLIRVYPDEEGTYTLEKGKKYKVFANDIWDGGDVGHFDAQLKFVFSNDIIGGVIDVPSEELNARLAKDPSFTIQITYGKYWEQAYIYWLYNETPKISDTGGNVPSDAYGTEMDYIVAHLTGDVQVFQVNEEAEVVLRVESDLYMHTMNVNIQFGDGGIDNSKPRLFYKYRYMTTSETGFEANIHGLLELLSNTATCPNLSSGYDKGVIFTEEDTTHYLVEDIRLEGDTLEVGYGYSNVSGYYYDSKILDLSDPEVIINITQTSAKIP